VRVVGEPVRWLVALSLAVLLLPAGAGAATAPQTTLNDVEDEVMCPICGTLLELADSPQARREKVFVAKLIAEGRSKAEIKDALVAQYGPAVLAQPEGSGFDLSAYLVPAIAIAAAIVALAFSLARWRRESERAGAEPAPAPREEDAQRLDADMRRYDL
jgi:cytochrome c-type biogenesis protein CcmH/NrfF